MTSSLQQPPKQTAAQFKWVLTELRHGVELLNIKEFCHRCTVVSSYRNPGTGPSSSPVCCRIVIHPDFFMQTSCRKAKVSAKTQHLEILPRVLSVQQPAVMLQWRYGDLQGELSSRSSRSSAASHCRPPSPWHWHAGGGVCLQTSDGPDGCLLPTTWTWSMEMTSTQFHTAGCNAASILKRQEERRGEERSKEERRGEEEGREREREEKSGWFLKAAAENLVLQCLVGVLVDLYYRFCHQDCPRSL